MEAPRAPDLQEHRGNLVSKGRHTTCAHGWDPAPSDDRSAAPARVDPVNQPVVPRRAP